MEHGQAVIVVGIGFSSGADARDIVALVTGCLQGRRAASLAVPRARAALPQAREAAAMLGLPLVPVEDDAIETVQSRCLTRPCRAARAVAEGAALAGAGAGSVLLGPRAKAARVTCALASSGA